MVARLPKALESQRSYLCSVFCDPRLFWASDDGVVHLAPRPGLSATMMRTCAALAVSALAAALPSSHSSGRQLRHDAPQPLMAEAVVRPASVHATGPIPSILPKATTACNAQSAIQTARESVDEGDRDGDDALNAEEFERQLLKSHGFRQVCCDSPEHPENCLWTTADAQFHHLLAQAAFEALDVDQDGKLDREPFANLEQEAPPIPCKDDADTLFLTDVEGNLRYMWLFMQQANFHRSSAASPEGKLIWMTEEETGAEITTEADLLYSKHPVINLKPGLKFVFGGDAVDQRQGNMRFTRALVELAKYHENSECVDLILGPRDVSKMRLKYEIAPELWPPMVDDPAGREPINDDDDYVYPMGLKVHMDYGHVKKGSVADGMNDLVPFWTATGGMSYHDYLTNKYGDAAQEKLEEDSRVQRTEWILEGTMDAKGALLRWQKEMAIVGMHGTATPGAKREQEASSGKPPFTKANAAHAMYCAVGGTTGCETGWTTRMGLTNWPEDDWLFQYIELAKVAVVHEMSHEAGAQPNTEKILYTHSGPLACGKYSDMTTFADDSAESHSCINKLPFSGGPVESGDAWVDAMNEWKNGQDGMLAAWAKGSLSKYNAFTTATDDGMGSPLIHIGQSEQVYSVTMGRYVGADGLPMNTEDTKADIKKLVGMSIRRVIVGGMPVGWLPIVGRYMYEGTAESANSAGTPTVPDDFQMVGADTSNSDGNPADRSIASAVIVKKGGITIKGSLVKTQIDSLDTAQGQGNKQDTRPDSANAYNIFVPAPDTTAGARNAAPGEGFVGTKYGVASWVRTPLSSSRMLVTKLSSDGAGFDYKWVAVPTDQTADQLLNLGPA